MTRRTFASSVLAVVTVLVVFAQPVFALPQTKVAFDNSTQTVKFWIAAGDTGTVYTVHVIPYGCVDTLVGTVDVTGPDDSGTVALTCLAPDSTGRVDVAFCLDINCFDTKVIHFTCRSECDIYSAGPVPGLTTWGALLLILLLIATAVWVLRRKRMPVHQQ